MQPDTHAAPPSKAMLWTGRVISALPVLGLIMSAAMKFTNSPDIVKGFEHLGWPLKLAMPLGVLELTCTALYAIPQTSVLGAILLTGYLGGATATHVRVGDNFAAPIILGVLVWLGLFLRDPRLRALLPLRS
jgi:DoxX-like family